MKKKELNLKETIGIVIWSFKLGFQMEAKMLAALILSNLVTVVLPVLQTYLLALIIQELINIVQSNIHSVTSRLVTLIVSSILTAVGIRISQLFYNYSYMRLRHRYDQMLWVYYLNKIAELDVQYHEDPKFKHLENKVKEAIGWRFFSLTKQSNDLIANVIGLTVLGIILVSINIIFLILIVIPVVLNYYINKKFGRDIYGIYDYKGDERKHADHAAESLNDNDVLREAKIYGFAPYLVERYRLAFDHFIRDVKAKLQHKFSLLFLTTIFDVAVFVGIQMWFVLDVIAQKITIGDYSFYTGSLGNLSRSLNSLEESISSIIEYSRYQKDFKTLLETKDIITKPVDGTKLEQIAPEIEFRNVSFKYPNTDTYILKNVSFKISPGEKVSLVGVNGAGKTTIIKLLARFYDIEEGEILINGKNIKELDLPSYYKLWGVLFQHFAKYWFTVRENIGIGNLEDIENIDLIKTAAEKAEADAFIQKLPDIYENMLSTDYDKGVDLSGGQWQKVGIARGMFANPKLIILDEPTSALDALAEAQVFEEIEKVANDTTMLIVSHRFATVRNADKILVLENGEIKEQGSHEELMKTQGLYHQMFTTQAEGYK